MSPQPDSPRQRTSAEEILLNDSLTQLRAASGALMAPPRVEAALMNAFVSTHKAREAKRRWRAFLAQWLVPGAALAASVGMSAWMVLAPMARPMIDYPIGPALADSGFGDAPFIALRSLEQIAMEPGPRVIETTVPRMWLASYGVAVNPETAGESMRAEMLVAANGQPLAMRFRP
jgi:hypothetical protein